VSERRAAVPLPLQIGADVLHDPESVLVREWLVTNGLGGYGSATLAGANTRRYHGLLVAALEPPVKRTVLLAGVLEEVTTPAGTLALSTHEFWDGTLHPQGFQRLETVEWEGAVPVFVYDLGGGGRLERRIWMEQGRNATILSYTLRGRTACALTVAPLCTARDFHQHTHGPFPAPPLVQALPGGLAVRMRPEAPTLQLSGFPLAEVDATGEWWWRFLHRVERERGLDAEEDLYRAGRLRFQLEPDRPVALRASVEVEPAPGWSPAGSLAGRVGREAALRSRARRSAAGGTPMALRLALAGDQFVVERPPEGSSIIAGYHWFSDWGRDTMISLPGLCLATGRSDSAREILRTFARYLDSGVIPNRFPDDGAAPEFNTADATLWFILAAHAYLEATRDRELITELLPAFEEVIRWHRAGTPYGIHVDEDGLLAAGQPGIALTWMDARVDGQPVTPRMGKPVEINALWYNALRLIGEWCWEAGRPSQGFTDLAERVRESFARRFWYAAGDHCFDVVDGPDGDDPALRPNQLLAISLPHRLLDDDRARRALAVIRQHLLTPVGLRTLAPSDPRYIGTYRGDQRARDLAYHQGAVWPWLLGPFWEAHLRLHGDAGEVERALAALEGRLTAAGVGTIGEIFEGDPPHRAVGCIAQAWSVGEALRLVALLRKAELEHRDRMRSVLR